MCGARRPSVSNLSSLRRGPLPCPRGGQMFGARKEALCAEPERRPFLSSLRGGLLCRVREEALSLLSRRGGPLCRAREEVLVSSLR